MAANAGALIMHTNEPLFYAKRAGQTMEGLPAEEFHDRVRDHIRTHNLVGAQAAGFAANKLRGDAHIWFNGRLKALKPVLRAAALLDVEDFWVLFRAKYFKVNSTMDVTTEWASLERRMNEMPTVFFDRTIDAMQAVVPLLPMAPTDAAALREVRDRINDASLAFLAHDGDNTHVNIVNAGIAVDDALAAYTTVMLTQQTTTTVHMIMLKVLATGMRHQKLREVVNNEEMNFISLDHAYDAVAAAEKKFDAAYWTKPASYLSKGQFQNPVSNSGDGETDKTEQEEGIDAVKGKSTQKQSRPGSNPTNKGADKKDKKKRPFVPLDFTKPPPDFIGPCKHCKKKGHWQKDCPKQSTGTGANRTDTNPEQDIKWYDGCQAFVGDHQPKNY